MNDSIERIKKDAGKLAYQYWNCEYVCDCKYCPSRIDEIKPYEYYGTRNCLEAMNLDIIERTVKVMEFGKGQEWVTHENIVRCKDCKYAGTNDCILGINVPFNPDAFCSWGEAR